MCLDIVDGKINQGKGVGYKCFIKRGSYFVSPNYPSYEYEYNVWVTDEKDKRIEFFSEHYPCGFHSFLKRGDARK
jgi:hypothetical protein